VKAVIASRKVEQQSYKTCLAILKLADAYSAARLEGACEKALYYHSCPSFRSIKTILKTGSDKRNIPADKPEKETQQHAIVRGTTYYGGNNHGE
jgi:hypothetical protein